jgi:hypothetical protein
MLICMDSVPYQDVLAVAVLASAKLVRLVHIAVQAQCFEAWQYALGTTEQ